jgi:hypothetical protein
MAYETEYSKFPTQNITLHEFKNISDDGITYTLDGVSYSTTINKLVAQINTLRASSVTADKVACVNLMNAVKDTLAHYMVDAETFNTWEQEIYNTQVYAQSVLQSTHFGTEEPDCQVEDVWIGDAEATDYD